MKSAPFAAATLVSMVLLVSPGDATVDPPAPVTTLRLACEDDAWAGADVPSMEANYTHPFCWAHVGAHHYFVGNNTTYRLEGGVGRALAVEVQYDGGGLAEGRAVDSEPPRVGVTTPLVIETSLDGANWTRVATGDHRLVSYDADASLEANLFAHSGLPDAACTESDPYCNVRQWVAFTVGPGPPFRFLRVREPLGAGGGLSGFLDWSELALNLTVPAQPPAPPRESKTVTKRCERDLLEDVRDGIPSAWNTTAACSFGGIHRFEAPTFFHTYYLGNATLQRVAGRLLVVEWRAEPVGDGGPFPLLSGPVLVQRSPDGIRWVTIDRFTAESGVPRLFDLGAAGTGESRFVRIVAGPNAPYSGAAKHPWAFVVWSEVEVTGLLA
ncbi:MAG: hypothetical protein ACT4PT_05490 [Methanobacteriota archaeon]